MLQQLVMVLKQLMLVPQQIMPAQRGRKCLLIPAKLGIGLVSLTHTQREQKHTLKMKASNFCQWESLNCMGTINVFNAFRDTIDENW